MYLTKDDLDKIKNYIGKTGIKDSDFPLITKGNGNEQLVILSSDSKNNRVSLQTFFEIARDVNNKTLLGKEIEFLGKTYDSVDSLLEAILLYLKDLISKTDITIGATKLLKVNTRNDLSSLSFDTLEDVVILAYVRDEDIIVLYYPITLEIKELKGEDAYQVIITSSAGQFSRNGTFNSILKAYVLCGGEDITDSLGPEDCLWVLNSGNSYTDKKWNEEHAAVGNVIVINNMLLGNAVIECIVQLK